MLLRGEPIPTTPRSMLRGLRRGASELRTMVFEPIAAVPAAVLLLPFAGREFARTVSAGPMRPSAAVVDLTLPRVLRVRLTSLLVAPVVARVVARLP